MRSTIHNYLPILVVAVAFALLASPAVALEPENYAIETASVSLTSTQAGEHADMTIAFKLTDEKNKPFANTRDVDVHLPPGVIGNPQAIPRCTSLQFSGSTGNPCPINTQVGAVKVTLGGDKPGTFVEPLYNLEPSGADIVARFGLYAAIYPVIINVRVDPSDYSVVASVEGASAAAGLIASETTIWGVPADPSHDELRVTPNEVLNGGAPPGGRPSGLPEVPFFSNPTDCSLPRQVRITATSYELPSSPSSKLIPYPQITGCGKLEFAPSFSIAPSNPEAAAPTGLDTTLTIPQDETPNGLATSTLRKAVVTLPPGFTINPAAGDGLVACSGEQVGLGNNAPPQCPDAAKIGSLEAEVPALERTLKGAVYQRTPSPGRLFGFWLVSDEQGVRLKLPAEIEANPLTGQLSTIVAGVPALGGNPQVPVEQLRLRFFGGPRAPVATPATCGTYLTHFEFTPWSGKAPAVGDAPMQISSGCSKGGFSPHLSAGSVNPSGGSFSPFAMTLTRSDGEANPLSMEVHLPQGLLAKLGGVPLCPDAAAATGQCPVSSQIGTLTAASGVGPLPLWIPQPGKPTPAIYLSGAYKGPPYSIVATVPAQAGPFDLGTVVTRAGIYVDPETALATIKTDPLPQILEGVPIAYRTIHVDVDRPEFTLNPTSCKAKKISAVVHATNGAVANPSDDFQATNCARLDYSPKLKLRFRGSTRRTGHPAVKAVLTQKGGQANTKSATVILPPTMFIDQNHINNPCTRVQFAANACPKGSILGTAKATTPLLDQPLSGPVYFRSNGGERELPDIVADLNGPFRIVLVGFIDSVGKKGSEARSVRTRFANVPDAPVGRFEMNLFGGKRGLLVNSRNFCATGRRAKLRFTAQNGRQMNSQPVIGSDCDKR